MSLRIKFRPTLLVIFFGAVAIALASLALAYQANLIPASRLINPDDLVQILQSAKSEKPLVIQVGSHVLYTQAHIPGSEYIGPASSESGLQSLRKRVEPVCHRQRLLFHLLLVLRHPLYLQHQWISENLFRVSLAPGTPTLRIRLWPRFTSQTRHQSSS